MELSALQILSVYNTIANNGGTEKTNTKQYIAYKMLWDLKMQYLVFPRIWTKGLFCIFWNLDFLNLSPNGTISWYP